MTISTAYVNSLALVTLVTELKMKLAEETIEFTSGLPSSVVTAVIVIIMAAVAWGFLMLAFDIAAIESSFSSLASVNGAVNFGGSSYAYY